MSLLALAAGLLALLAFNFFGWFNLLGDAVPKWSVVALVACTIAMTASIRPTLPGRVMVAVALAFAAWPLFVVDGIVLGHFKPPWWQEGGPIAWALLVGYYVAIPVLVLAPILATALHLLSGPKLGGH